MDGPRVNREQGIHKPRGAGARETLKTGCFVMGAKSWLTASTMLAVLALPGCTGPGQQKTPTTIGQNQVRPQGQLQPLGNNNNNNAFSSGGTQQFPNNNFRGNVTPAGYNTMGQMPPTFPQGQDVNVRSTANPGFQTQGYPQPGTGTYPPAGTYPAAGTYPPATGYNSTGSGLPPPLPPQGSSYPR
jgi:hypothetical protein